MDIGINSVLPPVTTTAASAQAQIAPLTPRDESGGIGTGPRAAAAITAPPEESREPVEDAVTLIQSYVQTIRRDLSFSLDDSSGRVVVKVTDSASGEVIRQLPSEEALRLAESLEEVRSLLFKAEA